MLACLCGRHCLFLVSIAISISDPMAHLLNDIDDVEIYLPGAIKAIREVSRKGNTRAVCEL
jgi:hypothetical protein